MSVCTTFDENAKMEESKNTLADRYNAFDSARCGETIAMSVCRRSDKKDGNENENREESKNVLRDTEKAIDCARSV
jgi:hypothetical protein